MKDMIEICGEFYTTDELLWKTDPDEYVWQSEMADYIENTGVLS